MHFPSLTRLLPVFLAAGAFAADVVPTHVPSANPRVAGAPAANVLSPELLETKVATGAIALENGSGYFKFYGYNDDGNPFIPTVAGSKTEAHKTEPDKNAYLILRNQKGADPNYNYGTHFLFQGHEIGLGGYVTRVNLDADGAHRITLISSQDANVASPTLPTFDGITWYPFSQKLLLTSEGSLGGGVWQVNLDPGSKMDALTGIMGQGGYEGIQADDRGNLIIVEDAGGSGGTVNTHAKRPNSFIYRFIPKNPSDLTQGGKLQALQVMSLSHSGPITFTGTADEAILSPDVKDLHTYHDTFQTIWVTIHDTDVNGTAPFNANALAKTALATPFKRPENGQFRPGTGFSEFVFDETGDTNLLTEAGTTYGGFGAIFRLQLNGDSGALSLIYNGDSVHAGFDNCAFWDADRIVFVEDAGDTLHTQRNALDSAWLFDLNEDYSSPSAKPVRILAQGRDASATLDTILPAFPTGTFPNEGDNEITGWHFSNGDATVRGLLGAMIPKPFQAGWRLFYTQQHGDNNTFEILSKDTIKDGN